jgi:hypothetical protein
MVKKIWFDIFIGRLQDWKIAGLEDCKIGQPLNFDFQGMTK